jgi:hypothetical protein
MWVSVQAGQEFAGTIDHLLLLNYTSPRREVTAKGNGVIVACPGHHCINGLDLSMEKNEGFGVVLMELEGRRWSRRGWNGPGQFIELQVPDEHSKMSLPYLFITTVQGDRVPWLASQTDLLARDWYCL